MIKKIRRRILRQYRIVKKFSTLLEAHLAEEILNLYHVRTIIIRHYLLVLPQDYRLAYRVLNSYQ